MKRTAEWRIALMLVSGWIGVAPAARAEGASSAAPAPRDESHMAVEVHVTAVAGESVYLDAGREEGLEAGDVVVLEPAGGGRVEVRVVSVSWTNARAQFDPGQEVALDIGTRGVVRVPIDRMQPAPKSQEAAPSAGAQGQAPAQDKLVPAPNAAPAQDGAPQALPAPAPVQWQAPPEEWSSDMPLLAPPKPVTAKDRPVQVKGSAFLHVDQTFDDGSTYLLARTGTKFTASNLFGKGGLLTVDVEAFARDATLEDAPDKSSNRLRLDRLSYLWGGLRDEPHSFEVGRFMQRMMPEFGVLDGAEWTFRTKSGDRIGASLGFLPDWGPTMSTGDDLSVTAAWRHYVGEDDRLSIALGLQKTWHEGDADRDLAVGTLDWRPDDTLSLHGSAWFDLYGSSEQVKDSGGELTEAHLFANKRIGEKSGVTFAATELRFPDLLRHEYSDVTANELDTFENTRFGLSGWRDVAEKTRLSGRVDYWMDDSDDGIAGDVRVGVRDRWIERGEVWASLFAAQGKYSDVSGLRLGVSRATQLGQWSLGWESGLYQQDGFNGAQEDLWQHVVRGSFDRDLSQKWDLSLWADQRFGDEQQATSIGFMLRRRF